MGHVGSIAYPCVNTHAFKNKIWKPQFQEMSVWLIEIYATRDMSACKSYKKTSLVFVAL